ncbi:MAG TPA: hypothetical protein VN843_01360, partial [Anaerolineales bacterium]|nr:hypothetical protein [Anaerolineales bacterium]
MTFLRWIWAAAIRAAILVAWVLGLGAIAIVGLCISLVAASRTLKSSSAPALSYQEAMNRFSEIQSGEQQQVSPLAQSILLTHGYKTSRVVLFFHGYSSSPQQFRALGEKLFRTGFNV